MSKLKDKDRDKMVFESLMRFKQSSGDMKRIVSQRIHNVTILLCSGGILTILYTLQFIVLHNSPKPALWPIFIAAIVFLASIMLNLFAQFASKKAHSIDEDWSQSEINEITTGIENNIGTPDFYNSMNGYFGWASIALMFFGIILLLCFVFSLALLV